MKKLNQDVDFVYGISSEEDDIYIRNTEIYLATKGVEKRGIWIGKTEGIEIGEECGVVKTMLEYNATVEDIIKKTSLTEEEIKDIIK